jgi:ABC-type microcin C transport system permease subunit YejB
VGSFVLRRLALSVPVLFGVATLVFSLIHLIPGDPAQAMLGDTASAADVDALRNKLGLDRPLLEQYGVFLLGLVHGDLGTSLRTGDPVAGQIWLRVPATMELAGAAMVVASASPTLGVLAVRRSTSIDACRYGGADGHLRAQFRLGPLAIVPRCSSMATRLGARHLGAPGAAGDLTRRGPGRDPGAHDAGDAARGTT